MKWTPGGSNEDIEDRRDSGGGGVRGSHIGIGGFLLLGVLSLVFKRDLITPFIGTNAPVASTADPARTQAEQPQVEFVTFVFNDVQRTMEQGVSG